VSLLINNTAVLNSTELMPNQVDRDFSGPSAWADVDLASYSEVYELEIEASGVGQYCTCPVASVPTDVNTKYELSFEFEPDIGSWDIKSFDGTQLYGTVSSAGTQTLVFTATTTGGIPIVAVDADSAGVFDDFSLKRYGPSIN